MKLNIVPARTGIQWVKLGVQTFFKQPLALAGLFFMYFMAVSLLASLPVVGPVAAVVLVPAATVGIMAAAREALEGRFPMPSLLVSAFRAGPKRARAMLALGAIYAVLLLAIVLVASVFQGAAPAEPTPATTDPAALQAPQLTAGLFILVLLQLPLLVVFAHAPALVHWHSLGPVKSLFFSLVAFWRNLGAFLVFGAAWLLILLFVGLGIRLILELLGGAPTVAALMPPALIVASMGTCSMYFTFRDCYQDDAAPDTTTSDTPTGGDTP